MSARRKRKSKIKKVSYKDKKWYTVLAPKIFEFKEIGDILGLENSILNRTIEALYYDFTDDFRDINLKLRFKIIEVNHEAKKCSTIFIGHQYTNDFIRSLVGRGSTKVQLIENYTTKDKYVFRITTNCITIKRARSSQQILIRKIIHDILREFSKELNHEKFIIGMINGEFANQIARIAKTVYPLSSCTIIKSKLMAFPEGGVDQEVPDEEFDIVEVEVKRSRKSEIKRTERINVKKLSKQVRAPTPQPEKKEIEEEKEELTEEKEVEENSE